MSGAGDITSNVLDLLQFDRALFAGDFINQEYLNYMFDFTDGYSCRWMQDNANSPLHRTGNHWKASDAYTIYHGGRTPCFISYNIVMKRNNERLYVIMLFEDNENSKESSMRIVSQMGAVLNLL